MGEVLHQFRLGIGFSGRIDSAFASPLMVDLKHEPDCGLVIHVEYAFQHLHDKLHGRDIIVEKQHP